MLNLAAVSWLKADKGHDTHVHDGRKVVKDGNDGENEQLIASVGAKQRQCFIELHRSTSPNNVDTLKHLIID